MYEIEKMAETGMIPSQIIIARTRNAAHVAGVEDKLGTLESGKIADLLIVKGDPSQNVEALEKL